MLIDALYACFFAVFIFVGRWLYQHPTKIIPTWGLLNRENPHVKTLARAYAVFVIFFGLFGCTGILTSRFFPNLWPAGLLVAIIGTWFLRPRILKPASRSTADDLANAPPKVALFSAHWERFLVIAGCVAIVLFVALSTILDKSDVSKQAFFEAEGNASLKQRLGEPIKRGWLTSGSLTVSDATGFANGYPD